MSGGALRTHCCWTPAGVIYTAEQVCGHHDKGSHGRWLFSALLGHGHDNLQHPPSDTLHWLHFGDKAPAGRTSNLMRPNLQRRFGLKIRVPTLLCGPWCIFYYHKVYNSQCKNSSMQIHTRNHVCNLLQNGLSAAENAKTVEKSEKNINCWNTQTSTHV